MIYYSPSQLNMFQKCMAQYYFRYKEGLKIPPKASLTLGGAVDVAVIGGRPDKEGSPIGDLRHKMETGQLLGEKDLDDVFIQDFDTRAEETEWEVPTEKDTTREEGRSIIRVAHQELCPKITPVAVQQKFTIEFSNVDYKLIGYADYIDGDTICDLKVSSRRFSQQDIQEDLQLTAYAMGLKIPKVRFDQAIRTKAPTIYQLESFRREDDFYWFRKLLGRMHFILENNLLQRVFLPPKHTYICSPKWCGYWNICLAGRKF